MSRYENIKFVLIAPKELMLPDYVKEEFLTDGRLAYTETESLEEVIGDLDILYMTRVQGERFEDKAEYERLKDAYILNRAKLDAAKPDLAILHPLPRVNEIDVDVDEDPRAAYFEQAENGRYIRMAIILKLLSEKNQPTKKLEATEINGKVCKNPACITRTERGIKHLFKGDACAYCDQK